MIHGGAWRFGSKRNRKVRGIAEFLQARGYAAFAIDYQLGSPENPVAWPRNLLDCKVAVQWLRANAQAHGIAPERIGAIGLSAGGQLAAMLAVTTANPQFQPRAPYAGIPASVATAIDFYGPLVIRGWAIRSFVAQPARQRYAPKASPLSYVKPGVPPMMVVYGSRDNQAHLSDACDFVSALEHAEVSHKLVIVDGAAHGFDPLSPPTDVSEPMLGFLQEHLGFASCRVGAISPGRRIEPNLPL